MKKIIEQAKKTKNASIKLANTSTESKNKALEYIAQSLVKNKKKILQENRKDLENAKKLKISKALLKRLKLDNNKLSEMVQGLKSLIKIEDPVGKTIEAVELDRGLNLYKVTSPIGVIGVIFESRPDALVQISSLCIKSGNATILKGGSEALNSNRILSRLIRNSISKARLPSESIQLLETRQEALKMLKLDKYIDLIIPRGSNTFVGYIMRNTKIPVLGHSAGVCHVYVDKDAKLGKAVKISFDAKCQYAAVCNAMETLLVHKSIAERFLPLIIERYRMKDVEIRGCPRTIEILKHAKKTTEGDWATEYNDLILSIRIVDNIDGAINHINKYGSRHTDAIVTENKKAAERFMNLVDSSSVMWNCSTRFSDGFRYGKGAEVGISTNKIHARGPVGLEGLVIYKYKLVGKGHIVADYSGKKSKRFTHRKIK